MRILVVEDTADIGEAIVARLARMGHAVDWERDGDAAADMLGVQDYDLLVLDIMLPGRDGIALLKELRARRRSTPVLVLTARSGVEDRVGALDLGADDYLVKPFDYRELEARARALLRRRTGDSSNVLTCGDVTIDRAARLAAVQGRPLDLTRRELTVLEILATRPGRIVSKDDLLDQIYSFDQEPSPNAVEQYVTRIRRKLAGSSVEIRTLRGLGYQLVVG
ncbi:response regulator transcription factor [Inquilinus sp.]|uniref:response regulator transcription factor n=1 Tax=Inquilinus sp. TaxID=1932117 RepID=UPI0031DC5F58